MSLTKPITKLVNTTYKGITKLTTSITVATKKLNYLTLSLVISLTSILPILLPAIVKAAPGDWQWQKSSNGIVGDQMHWTSIASSSDGTKLATVGADWGDGIGYIYTSTDSGATWTRQAAVGSLNWTSIASSSDGTKLSATTDDGGSGGYIYTSTDSGATWTEHTSSGQRYWSSITSSSDGTKLAAVEFAGYIYTSTDSGVTWTEQTHEAWWQSIASSSNGTKLAVVDYFNGYIYTSTDSGTTWTTATASGQRYWQSITSSSDGTKLAAVAYGGYIYTSTDSGATWTEQTSSGQRGWYSIASSSDGTKLAAVAYGGYIYTSTDSGATWQEQTSAGNRNWKSITSSSDGTKLASVAYDGSIYLGTIEPATTPNTTTNLSTTRGNNQVSLTWTAPSSDGGSPITDYIVQYKPTADSTWQTFADGVNDNTSVDVTGLDSNTSYDFRVAAKNDVGDGSFSSIVTVTTLAETPPSTPTANLTTPTSPISAFSLKPVSLTTPTGTTINSSSTVPESSLVTQDNNNQYPIGLVNFSFTTNQSSNQVVLNFETDLKPNQVTPRKYNSNTNTYNNLPDSANVSITETTINNKHHLTLTYTLIDNGELDLDPTIGIVKDPVGLAVTNALYSQLANTGTNNFVPIIVACNMVIIATSVAIFTQKKKRYQLANSGLKKG